MMDQTHERRIHLLLNQLADERSTDRDLWPDIQRRMRAVAPAASDPTTLVVQGRSGSRLPLTRGDADPVPSPRSRSLTRQWLELAAAVLAFVLVGALLVAIFRGMTGNPGERAAGPVFPDQQADGLLWVISTVFGAESGFEVETTGRVTAYDATTGAEVYVIDAGNQVDAVLSPDGSTLYVASISTTAPGDDLVAHDARTGDELWRVVIQDRVHYRLQYGPSSLTVSPDGERLLVYSTDAPNRAWVQVLETATREVVASVDVPYCAADMHLSPDGRTLFVLCQGAGVSRVIDLTTMQPVELDPSLPWPVAGTALSPDGRRLYAVARQGMETEAVIIDLAERAIVERVGLDGNPVPARLLQLVTLSADGRYLFVGTNSEALPENEGPSSNAVLVYDTVTWEVAQIATAVPITAQTLAPTPSGRGVFAANNTFREGTSIPKVGTILRLDLGADPTTFVERPREEIIRMFTFRNVQSLTDTPTPSPVSAGEGCPVVPYGDPPPDAGEATFTDTWFAGDGLWAGLGIEADGVWGEGANRVLWWRQNPHPLTVTGHRIDGDAPPLEAHIFDGYEGMSHQITTLSFPTPGCWEVTGLSGDTSLTFVVEVVPLEETSAYQREQARNADAEANRQKQIPYPVPDTCPATSWIGPESLNIGIPTARYQLDGDGLTLGQDIGLLFEGPNTVYWIAGPNVPLADAVRGAIALTGTHVLDPQAQVDLEMGSQLIVATGFGEEGMWRAWTSTVTFPAPGCWTLEASIGLHTLNAIVYVYPLQYDDVPGPTVVDTTPRPGSGIPWLAPEQEDRARDIALADARVHALLESAPVDYTADEVALWHDGLEQIGGVVKIEWDTPITIDGEWLTSDPGCAVDGTPPYWMASYRAAYSNVTVLAVHVDLRLGMVVNVGRWHGAVLETLPEFPENTIMPPDGCSEP